MQKWKEIYQLNLEIINDENYPTSLLIHLKVKIWHINYLLISYLRYNQKINYYHSIDICKSNNIQNKMEDELYNHNDELHYNPILLLIHCMQ